MSARTLAVEATKLAPDLVPAAALAGRLLAEGGERRKAGKIIEAAWKANPHPDLAEAYAHVRLSDSARDRLSRMQALARMAPGHAEGALAVARAALDAREFATARDALEPLLAEPTQRVAMLMAELERARGRRGPRARMDGRARSTRRAIRPGPRTASCPTAGCRSRRSPGGSMRSSGRCRWRSSASASRS